MAFGCILGSNSINGMVFVRGQAQDFDTWAQMGNRGWSYTEVLPFFKRMESYAGASVLVAPRRHNRAAASADAHDPAARISRAIRLRPCFRPPARSSACTRGTP